MPQPDALASLRVFPALSFWYGLGWDELTRMPNWALRMYAEELPALQAQREMLNFRASSFPHLKTSERSKMLYEVELRGLGHRTGKISKDQYQGVLAGVGIGFAGQSDG